MGYQRRIATLAVLMILVFLPEMTPAEVPQGAALENGDEYDIKAAFLINFIRFTEWPGDAFAGPNTPLVLVIFGKDPFGRAAFNEVASKPVNGRRLEIRRTKNLKDIEGCHFLFINSVDDKALAAVINTVRNKHVLTVGEGSKFSEAGGMIRFYIENTNVKFEIKLTEVQHSDLKISANLLNLAKVIR